MQSQKALQYVKMEPSSSEWAHSVYLLSSTPLFVSGAAYDTILKAAKTRRIGFNYNEEIEFWL